MNDIKRFCYCNFRNCYFILSFFVIFYFTVKNVPEFEDNLNLYFLSRLIIYSPTFIIVDRVNKIVPDITNLMNTVREKQANLNALGKDVSLQIEELKKKVAQARDLANR